MLLHEFGHNHGTLRASLNFPRLLPGFAGQRLQQVIIDRDLALDSVRAWNDWHFEVLAGSHPDRIIPCQLPWLLDPDLGAKTIYENAERDFHAVTFSKNPATLGFPSIHSGHWDPMMADCAVEDQSSFVQRDRIGVDNIMLEADYPHYDSTWPYTQETTHQEIGGLPADVIRKITWENASRLYQHRVPIEIQLDRQAF